MTVSELLQNIEHTGESNQSVQRIEYDSRKARQGDLFVCLTGALRDGHDYAAQAYENGCRLFLCQTPLDLPEDAVQVRTPDTREALALLSAAFYDHPADKLKIIGITGTKGKTTTALLISAVLNAAGQNCAYIGSNGVIINGTQTETVNTTPESRELHHYFSLMVNAGVQIAVIEVSSQALAHHRVDGIHFDTVVFTNLSEDHIGPGEHPDFADYRDSKRRLFSEHGARCAVYNRDDPAWETILFGFTGETVSFGLKEGADCRGAHLSRYRTDTALGVCFDYLYHGAQTKIRLMSPGMFSAYNGLAVLAVCSRYGVDPADAGRTLAQTPVQGRFEIIPGTPGRTFIVDYSHNGLSLTSALTTLREYDPARLICVFGSVGGRTQGRRQELAKAASALADYSIITSDNPDYEPPMEVIREIASHMEPGSSYECIVDRAEAVRRAVQIAEEGDIILFAGKGHETYQLICGQKLPFVEAALIREACRELSAV